MEKIIIKAIVTLMVFCGIVGYSRYQCGVVEPKWYDYISTLIFFGGIVIGILWLIWGLF